MLNITVCSAVTVPSTVEKNQNSLSIKSDLYSVFPTTLLLLIGVSLYIEFKHPTEAC